MACSETDLTIVQGKTFSRVVRWEAQPFIYKAITAVTKAAPVSITSAAHGIPVGWRVAVVSVLGMTELNALNSPLRATDFRKAVVPDANTIQFNEVNSAGYSTYTSGGYLQFYTPVDITGYTARMTIKDNYGGTTLATLTVANGRVALDTALHTVTISINATDTAAFTFTRGIYDLEVVSPGGVVTALLAGSITVDPEVTT